MPTTTAASPRFLHQFVFVVGDHCIRRFQVAYPVALLAVPGLLYRNSNSGIVETFAWILLGLGAILILARGSRASNRSRMCIENRNTDALPRDRMRGSRNR